MKSADNSDVLLRLGIPPLHPRDGIKIANLWGAALLWPCGSLLTMRSHIRA